MFIESLIFFDKVNWKCLFAVLEIRSLQWIKTIYNENVYYGKDVWPSMVSHGRMHTIVYLSVFLIIIHIYFMINIFKLYFMSHDLFMLIFIYL